MSDTHYLGEFQSLSAAWKMFPNGAGYGDYITIGGVRYDWDESTNSWGEDPGDVNPALPEIVNHDIDVQGTVIARDGIKTADYIPNEAGAHIDHAGNAEFRSVNADIIRVQNPVTGKLISLAEFIKMFKTELPPDWEEYKQIPQFDDVRILAFDPLSNEKFYTTIGALKKLIADSGGTGDSGTFDIEILRSDDKSVIPTDNNVMSSLRTLLEIQGASSDKYLSRLVDDTAQGFIEFLKGISVEELATLTQGLEVGTFTPGALGAGAAIKMVNGTSYAEVDHLTVRQKATFRELIIEALKHIGGQLVLSPARMKCNKVVDGGTYYKCYFDTGDGEVSNEFVAGDLARCQVFTGNGTKFYWRLVTLVGEDWINLSKTSAAVGSDVPEAGDDIVQLGNATDTTRQSAIILSTVGVDAPSWKQYSGINSFSLEGKETTVFSKLGNKIEGKTVFTSGGTNLDDHLDGVAQDILDALQAAQDAEDKAQQAIEDAEADVATINVEIGRLQDQIDGKVSNWYYAYTPTLSNYPASDWTTNEIKDSHIGDTFTNTEPAPAENAGKSWRFVKNGSTYSWIVISDSDALKALQEASKAQATADGKSTTFLIQPTKYHLGDMWVLNSDQTVNGTLYKQGELLTATQDSETFVQAHWVKRVRYTDDTAVDELEIGGRNLILDTNSFKNTVIYANRGPIIDKNYNEFTFETGTNNTGPILLFSETLNEDNYVLSFTVVASEATELNYISLRANATQTTIGTNRSRLPAQNLNEGRNRVEIKFKGVLSVNCLWLASNLPEVVRFTISDLKLEKGNKPTDWTPAPEDVEASIETAKTEAESAAKAYADAKAEAERVLAEAYADGIVSDEEQARIDDVNAKLAAAKDYADAQDALLKTQQEAYADGKISAAEQAAIDAAKDYTDLKKTEAQAYADGIVSDEEARAIANALEKYNASKAHAEQLVENIEIGGRNLFRNTINLISTTWHRVSNYEWENSRGVAAIPLFTFTDAEGVESGQTYTLSFELRASNSDIQFANSTLYINSSTSTSHNRPELIEDEYIKVFGTFVYQEGTGNVHIYLINMLSAGDVSIRNFKLEKGNKATDWTPAPEDVQAEIDAIEIGGRNLYSNNETLITTSGVSGYTRNTSDYLNGFAATGGNNGYENYVRLHNVIKGNGKYTVSFEIRGTQSTPVGLFVSIAGIRSVNRFMTNDTNTYNGRQSFTVDVTNYTELNNSVDFHLQYAFFRIKDIQVEKGNKATDWTPAPEDVEAEIDSAKQEALSAASDAQSTADSLKNFTDVSFRDGIIDRSESAAIEKYKNTLNETMSKAEASYMKVFLNTYLEGAAKTDLEQAKINLWGQRDTLLSAINTAISGGATTPAQKTAVDNAFSSFNNLMTAFQNALEEANKAIQAKLDALSTEKVDNIEIGGRNLLLNTNRKIENSNYRIAIFNLGTYKPIQGETVTIAFKGTLGEGKTHFGIFNSNDSTNLTYLYPYDKRSDGVFSKTFNWNIGGSSNTSVRIFAMPISPSGVVSSIEDVMLVVGNKIAYYSEAPEDVDKKISDVDAKAAEAQAKANKSAAITDKFKTEINGGLITTVMMLLREVNSLIDTAGISGLQTDQSTGLKNMPSYWSGGTYEQAIAFVPFMKALQEGTAIDLDDYKNLPKIVFLHSGAGKLGDFIVEESGRVVMIDPATGVVRLAFNTENIGAIEDVDQSDGGSTNIGAGVAYYQNLILPGSVTVTKNGSTGFHAGGEISITASGRKQASGAPSICEVGLYMYRNGAKYKDLGYASVYFGGDTNETKTGYSTISSRTFSGLPTGIYTFGLENTSVGNISNPSSSSSASSFSWSYTVAGARHFGFGLDGLLAYFELCHLYFTEHGGLDVRGKTNMPGVLLSATVAAGGGWASVWGAKQSTVAPYKNSTGRYTIYHTLGHSNYQVFASSHTANRSYNIVSKGATNFIIEWRTIGSTPVLSDTTFDIQMVGNNYL